MALTTYTQESGEEDVEKLRGILDRDGFEFLERDRYFEGNEILFKVKLFIYGLNLF